MRRAARTDANQREIVEALRAVGATVQPLHTVGGGCPDLLVGWRGTNYLLEIKDGRKSKSRRRLTPDEEQFFFEWRGQAAVVKSADEALRHIGAVE